MGQQRTSQIKAPVSKERTNASISGPARAAVDAQSYSFQHLHGMIGNRAFGRFLQTKLQINEPGDEYEREADAVAEMVMRMPEPASPHVSNNSLASLTAPAYIQRKCAACESGNGLCPKCAEEEKPMVQRQALSLRITPIIRRPVMRARVEEEDDLLQTKLVLSKPGDKYEEEADQVADDIMARASSIKPVRKSEQETENRITPFVQRQIEPEEELEEPEPPGEEEDDEAVVQTKKVLGVQLETFDHAGSEVERTLRIAKSSGAPLSDSVRAPMEQALGADLSAVRIHTDTRADSLSRSLNAVAFTTGSDIFFRNANFDPSGSKGRRLLAHELTHVVQQNPRIRTARLQSQSSPTLYTPTPSAALSRHDLLGASVNGATAIQREEAEPESPPSGPQQAICGSVRMYDANGNEVTSKDPDPNFEGKSVSCPSVGIHPFEIFHEGTQFKIKLLGEVHTLNKYPNDLPVLIKKVKTFLLVVADPQFGLKDPNRAVVTPGPAGKEGEEGEAEAEKKKSGSQFGVFGLLSMPQWAIDALEAALKVLSSEEEMKAISDLLRAFKELSEHQEAFKELFADTDKLLEVALGIKENTAIDKLEEWVSKPSTKRDIKAKKKTTKGIAGIAKRLLGILTKIKNVLRPLFKARAAVRNVVGVVGGAIVELPAFEEIYERREDLKSNPAALDDLLESLAAGLSKSIQEKVEGLRTSFKMQRESFTEAELVQHEELARAVTDALLMTLKGPAKAVAMAARKVGLDQVVADNVIAPIIPKAALDAINDQLRKLTKLLDEKFISTVEGDVNNILTEFEFTLQQHLVPELKNAVISLSPKAGGGSAASVTSALLEMKKSRGEALPAEVKREMEGEFGFDFGDVRIYRDPSAQKASESLNANAFTLGSRVFFGPGQYAPNSEAGRRLLTHELTHVVQQRYGIATGSIQRDYKTTLDKLVKKFGSTVTSSIFSIGKPSAKKREQAETILNKVKKLIGKPVYSTTNPALPAEAYVYTRVDKKTKKPRGIRRMTKWLGLLPALSIVKSKIQLGLLSRLNPKARDRAALRAALGCDSKNKKEEAHHIIPLERTSHPVVKLAVKNGFGINTAKNGICLLPTTHRGSHPKYTAMVTQVLDALRTQNPGLVWNTAFAKTFDGEISKLRNKLSALNKSKRSVEEIK